MKTIPTNEMRLYKVELVVAVPRYDVHEPDNDATFTALEAMQEVLFSCDDLTVLGIEQTLLAVHVAEREHVDPLASPFASTDGKCRMMVNGNWCNAEGALTRTYVRPTSTARFTLRDVCTTCAEMYGVQF